MNIETLLEIERRMIADCEHRALEVLAQAWQSEGCPTDRLKLIAVLRRTLDCCERRGYSYPKIFLRRKGELTRREWQPRQIEHISRRADHAQPGFSCVAGWHLPTGGGEATKCDCAKGATAQKGSA